MTRDYLALHSVEGNFSKGRRNKFLLTLVYLNNLTPGFYTRAPQHDSCLSLDQDRRHRGIK